MDSPESPRSRTGPRGRPRHPRSSRRAPPGCSPDAPDLKKYGFPQEIHCFQGIKKSSPGIARDSPGAPSGASRGVFRGPGESPGHSWDACGSSRVPRGSPDASPWSPEHPPRAPRDPQGSPHDSPRAPKCHPGDPQGSPEGPKRAPETPPRAGKAPRGSPQGVPRSQGPPKRLPRDVLGRGVCTKYLYSDSVPRCVCMLSFSPGLNLSPWRCSNRHRTLCYSRTLTMRNIIVIH